MTYILYNPLAGNGRGKSNAELLEAVIDDTVTLMDMTKITNYQAFLADKADDQIIICGGDGTLNRFVNDTAALELEHEFFYFAGGSGNDFLRDLDIIEQRIYRHGAFSYSYTENTSTLKADQGGICG